MNAALDVIDIPVLIRGRVIPPGNNAITFGGRNGATFQQADPKALARQLVLRNPADLRDLYDTPTDEIIDFLGEIGPRVTLDNALMKLAFELALEAGDVTEPVLLPIYEGFPHIFDRDRMRLTIDSHVGVDSLDGWVE